MKKIVVSRLGAGAAVVAAAAFVFVGPAYAAPASDHTASPTTLDACGYFVGTQTVTSDKTTNGVETQHGTWSGVSNNYTNIPVASLGTVQGAFTQVITTDASGTTMGTETFTSNAGKIDQVFSYGALVVGGFSVTVTATRDLAFLTSDTNGSCYTGIVPRP